MNILDEDKKIKLDSNSIISKITETLGEKMRQAFSWIHTDEGQIVVRLIQSLSSYIIGDPTGAVMPLIFDSADDIIRKRFLKNVPDLMDRLDSIKPKINEEFVKTDEGQKLLRETLQQMLKEENEDKVEFLKRLLLNSYTTIDIEKERKVTYLGVLISLTPIDLRILKFFWHPEEVINAIVEKDRKNSHQQGAIMINLKDDLMKFMQIDEALFERSVTKLESEHLITRGKVMQWFVGSFKNDLLDSITQRMISETSGFLTTFGGDFLNFISI